MFLPQVRLMEWVEAWVGVWARLLLTMSSEGERGEKKDGPAPPPTQSTPQIPGSHGWKSLPAELTCLSTATSERTGEGGSWWIKGQTEWQTPPSSGCICCGIICGESLPGKSRGQPLLVLHYSYVTDITEEFGLNPVWVTSASSSKETVQLSASLYFSLNIHYSWKFSLFFFNYFPTRNRKCPNSAQHSVTPEQKVPKNMLGFFPTSGQIFLCLLGKKWSRKIIMDGEEAVFRSCLGKSVLPLWLCALNVLEGRGWKKKAQWSCVVVKNIL